MDIPAIHLVKANHGDDSSPLMLDAVENYLRIKGNDDRIFVRTAQRNGSYVAKLLGNRPAWLLYFLGSKLMNLVYLLT